MIDMLQAKLKSYAATNPTEEDNALKEILQEIALYALWRGDFFDVALFQGGTSLRILHGLPRFSEDLDFVLRTPDPGFDWKPYLAMLVDVFAQFGLKLEAQPKERMDRAVREALLKDDSLARQLDLHFAGGDRRRTFKIKLEIDTNPPAGSGEASSFLDFPADHEVRHRDLPSNFALKIHALLCRPYFKGRDWFDLSWYVAGGVAPNLKLLATALEQAGPWAGPLSTEISQLWLADALATKIAAIDWRRAADDVRRFLRPGELKSLDLWSERFFMGKVGKMVGQG